MTDTLKMETEKNKKVESEMDAHEFFKTEDFKSMKWYIRFWLRLQVAFIEIISIH